jgi:transcriptional regulator with XRE-family HTH domain
VIAAPYNQQRRTGLTPRGTYTERAEARTTMGKATMRGRPLQERFDAKWVRDEATGCHMWTAGLFPAGYGQFKLNGGPVGAHRVAWELAHGPVPDGMHVCHHCDTPACVNVAHLFLGDNVANVADKVAKGRQARNYGETNGAAILSDADVARICALRARGLSQRHIASVVGCSQTHVGHVVSGQRRPGMHVLPPAFDLRQKLTDDDIRKIRAEHARGGVTQSSLARMFGVAQSYISAVVHGKKRRGVPR